MAAVAAIAGVAAFAFDRPSGGHHPTTVALDHVLLTNEEFGATALGTFTTGDSSDDSSADSTTDCDTVDAFNRAWRHEPKADASRDFSDESDGMFGGEEVMFLPGAAADLVDSFKLAVTDCGTFSRNGATFTYSVLPAAPVPGSDDAVAIQLSGVSGGRTIAVESEIARFGDTLVTVTFVAAGDPAATKGVADQLIKVAAAKAQPAL
jgi:hypothetical protein